jgi:hypothetical protein
MKRRRLKINIQVKGSVYSYYGHYNGYEKQDKINDLKCRHKSMYKK